MRRRAFPAALLAVLLLCGCAGYRLGPSDGSLTAGRSIRVVPFENRTLEPRLHDALTVALRKRLQKDATLRLATHDDADVILTGRIVKYERIGLSYKTDDVVSVQDYRLMMTAHVTAQERATGRLLLDRDVQGYTLLRVTDDLVSAERQSLPLLSENLARNIADLLVDGTW